MLLLDRKIKKIQYVRITNKMGANALPIKINFQYYFLKRELFTPACSHFLIVGLKNDIGRAVKIAKETTRIKSVVK